MLDRHVYYRGLNDYQYHSEVHLRYRRPESYKEYGTIILVIIQAPILPASPKFLHGPLQWSPQFPLETRSPAKCICASSKDP